MPVLYNKLKRFAIHFKALRQRQFYAMSKAKFISFCDDVLLCTSYEMYTWQCHTFFSGIFKLKYCKITNRAIW